MLQVVANLFLIDHIRDLGGAAKEIKVFSDTVSAATTTKGIVVERILVVVELVAEAIVGIFEIDSGYQVLAILYRLVLAAYSRIIVEGQALSLCSSNFSERICTFEDASSLLTSLAISRQAGVESEERHNECLSMDSYLEKGKVRGEHRGCGGVSQRFDDGIHLGFGICCAYYLLLSAWSVLPVSAAWTVRHQSSLPRSARCPTSTTLYSITTVQPAFYDMF